MKSKYWLLLALVLSSCIYREIHLFNSDDLTWLSPYEQGDTVLFTSECQTDTMVVTKASLYNSTSMFRKDEGHSVYNANGGFHCSMKHGNQLIKCRYRFSKRKEDEIIVYLRVHERYYEEKQKDIHLQKVCYNGKEYDDAIVIDDSNSETKDYDKLLQNDYFIYSKSKGLLQYKYLNGDVYTFYKKIPRQK